MPDCARGAGVNAQVLTFSPHRAPGVTAQAPPLWLRSPDGAAFGKIKLRYWRRWKVGETGKLNARENVLSFFSEKLSYGR